MLKQIICIDIRANGTSKQFYELLIPKKGIVSRGFTELKNDFDLDDITVSKVFLNLLSVLSETFISILGDPGAVSWGERK